MNINKKKYLSAIFSIIFALYLANLPVDIFIDRNNYLNLAKYIDYIINARLELGISYFLSNEPGFALIILLVSQFLDPEGTIRAVIAFSTFVTFYTVLTNTPTKYIWLSLLILLLPQVLKNHIIHLRQGLAASIFLYAWFSNNNLKKVILFFIAALIHSSFIIILSGLLIIYLVKILNTSNSIRYILYTLAGLTIGIFGLNAARFLGARQGEAYQNSGYEGDLGLGFIFWLIIILIYTAQGSTFLKKHTSSIFFLILYLSTYAFLPVTARIFESVIVIILLSSRDLSNYRKNLFYIVYLSYFTASWLLRITKPGFGWEYIG